MMGGVIFFDLDGTLILERESNLAATVSILKQFELDTEIDAEDIIHSLERLGKQILSESQFSLYCNFIGISAMEILWCQFEGRSLYERLLRQWAPNFRRKVWSSALHEHNVCSKRLSDEVSEAFFRQRRFYQTAASHAVSVVNDLATTFRLGIITNGASCLQRQKIYDFKDSHLFRTVVVSSEIGHGKPSPVIFEKALRLIGASVSQCMMVGDNIERDIAGACAVGMSSILVGEENSGINVCSVDCVHTHSLNFLPEIIDRHFSRSRSFGCDISRFE